jgi:hypothetical protein
MADWLGVAILVSFSLGLTLFMRLDFSTRRELPKDLGRWQVLPGETWPDHPGARVERRVVLVEGGLLRRHRLVEQRRVRSETGEVLAIMQERTLERLYSL